MLSTAVLQTSRQLLFEAMPMLFKNRAITVEWLLPYRDLWSSWGEGCAMLRYLDILNGLNFRGVDTSRGYASLALQLNCYWRKAGHVTQDVSTDDNPALLKTTVVLRR